MKSSCLKKPGGAFLLEGDLELSSVAKTLEKRFRVTELQSGHSDEPDDFVPFAIEVTRGSEAVQLSRVWDRQHERTMIQLVAAPVGEHLELMRIVFDVLVQSGCIAIDNALSRYEDLKAGREVREDEIYVQV